MTNFKNEYHKFTGQLLQEFTTLSVKFADAVKDGANRSSGKIVSAVDEFVEPSSVLVQKLSTAVKEGENKQILEALESLIQPSSVFVHKLADAVKDGANIVGDKMITALEEAVKPAPVDAKKLVDAVKVGTNYANEKMTTAVDDFVQLMKTFKASKE
ncbi:hypothetical protein [Cohnella silvisoli]|uniref:Phasin family protein n=1 Tax=Cohnella silvisoli TaxID=2873699 RepID=A0ABV1L219_9BACL|nr:hypothetical protein [Cohnella silvisoli]MCD9026456.1 hypothetical protein [Cohnella silvisoli]